MDANNWTQCPKCEQIVLEKDAKAVEDLQASYGKIPAAEYLRRVEKARDENKDEKVGNTKKPVTTLREDCVMFAGRSQRKYILMMIVVVI